MVLEILFETVVWSLCGRDLWIQLGTMFLTPCEKRLLLEMELSKLCGRELSTLYERELWMF